MKDDITERFPLVGQYHSSMYAEQNTERNLIFSTQKKRKEMTCCFSGFDIKANRHVCTLNKAPMLWCLHTKGNLSNTYRMFFSSFLKKERQVKWLRVKAIFCSHL